MRRDEHPVVERLSGLYAVTPDETDTGRLVAMVAAALEGGATAVQYRNKAADAMLRIEQATRLAELCRTHRRPLIVNDHVDVAMQIAGAGLHVGADDADDLAMLRERLGPSRILGVSCYASLDRARDAVTAGANYVAFGSVFGSSIKPSAVHAPLALFAEARALGVALVGIGGIAAINLPQLIDAGADAAAIITALFDGREPAVIRERAAVLQRCFDVARVRAHDTQPDSLPRGPTS
jgi:thiamine-phosphate pyrophosphorylase